MANNKIKIEKWIDVNSFKYYYSGTYIGCIDWNSNIGVDFNFKYGDITGFVTIIDYKNGKVRVKYKDKEYWIACDGFKKGKIGILFNQGGITKEDIEKQKITRLGQVKYNKFGTKLQIIEYNSEDNLKVRFDDNDNCVVNSTYREFFKTSRLTSPLDKSICGIGYFGIGTYKGFDEVNKRPTKEYDAWRSMIRRCYGNLDNCKAYRDCTVCDEWLCFQTYAKWYEENYYKFKDEVMTVDKDILIKGNRVYSPDTCLIVPVSINSMFVKCKNNRGNLPIGVYMHRGKYVSHCADVDLGCQKTLGEFKDPVTAFNKYKEYKENYIKRKANEFKEFIPLKVYNAMINYKVEITD